MANLKLLVAAIDIGTTFSGYAFSLAHEFQRDPLKIHCNHWIGGGHSYFKAPTAVLFTPQKIFHSFGYEAEDKYMELAEDGYQKEWYYFRRFKMLLHENKVLSRKTVLEDEYKKPFEALKVFSSAIQYLKEHLIKVIQESCKGIVEDEVYWVLTVPAIWNESAKQFMKEAGIEAGLKRDHLLLALEQEVALIYNMYCKSLPVEMLRSSQSRDLEAFKSDTKYMVLDLGGGTVDITVHLVHADGTLSEIAKASGGAWGGIQVDKAFLDFLEQILGHRFLEQFLTSNTADFFELMRAFEAKKRTVKKKSEGMITMGIPASLVAEFKALNGKEINDHLSSTVYNGEVKFRRDRIQVDAEVFKQFFKDSISNTVAHVGEILAAYNIDTILLVGDFAESEIVQDTLRVAFSEKRIITPYESGSVVLKGAVLFGHNPKVVLSRVSKFTYGIEVNRRFDKEIHPEKYKFFDGIYRCRYVFDPFVRAGQVIPVDEVIRKSYTSNIIDVTEGVGIYASTSEFPAYVNDSSCFKLGNIYLDEPDHEVLVEMQFGGTEFSVQVTDLDTGIKRIGCFDFLCH